MNAARARPAELRLRAGGADDLDDVMRIMTDAFPPCFGEAWTRSQCAGILPLAGVSLTMADHDQHAIGFALARTIMDESELLLIAVEVAGQGQGAGRLLVEDFIAQARAQGASRLHLEVRDGNSAVSLYQSAGFVPAGRRRAYYKAADGRRHDAVTLVLVR
ncbi:GNAT family N-acetyltransferase [Sphingomonas xanthus]|uniref:GNAT family N-acetyltransferase n=1 Tax=Sphingomonas xanthus TaxID=2594473 RepID=A0A516ISW1_9SPHN|nr:GNAT family N-acetyltransferase [Sphingomonas xanthus]QDP19983.1 GNAT family N-acetyltransferase [Sphingomonas xanthus]